MLAVIYRYGWGVEQDYARAIELYTRAVEVDGNGVAMYDLAVIFQLGRAAAAPRWTSSRPCTGTRRRGSRCLETTCTHTLASVQHLRRKTDHLVALDAPVARLEPSLKSRESAVLDLRDNNEFFFQVKSFHSILLSRPSPPPPSKPHL